MKKRNAQEQKLADDARLLRAWKTFHREQLEETLNGPHGAAVVQVMTFLRRMTPDSAPALIALLHEHDWAQMDAAVRLVVQHEINDAICKLRERSGLPPIDDALPWSDEPPRAWQIIKKLIGGSP